MDTQHPQIEVAKPMSGGDNVSHEIVDYCHKKKVIKIILIVIIVCSAIGVLGGL